MANKKNTVAGLIAGILIGGAFGTASGVFADDPAPATDQEIIVDLQRQLNNERTRTGSLCDQLAEELGVEPPRADWRESEFGGLADLSNPLILCAGR